MMPIKMSAEHPLIQRFRRGNTALCAYNDEAPRLFHRWLNDQELITSMGDWNFMPSPYSNRSPEEYSQNTRNTAWLICAIKESEHLIPIGYTGIYVKPRHRIGIFRLAIPEKEYRNQGHGYRATLLFFEWAFLQLDLFAVHLTVSSSNVAAIALYQKCGFVECGRHTKARHEPSGRYDEIHMEVLCEHWRKNHQSVLC